MTERIVRAVSEGFVILWPLKSTPFAHTTKRQTPQETGFSSNRDIVGAFTWNVIETDKGTYDWAIPDATLAAAGDAGVALSAVVQP